MTTFDYKRDQHDEVIEEFQKEVKKYVYEDYKNKKVYKLEYEVEGGYEEGTVTRIIAKEIYYPLGLNYANRIENVLDIMYDVKTNTLKVKSYKFKDIGGYGGTEVSDEGYIEIQLPVDQNMEDPFFTYPDELEITNEREVPAMINDIKEYVVELVKDLVFY